MSTRRHARIPILLAVTALLASPATATELTFDRSLPVVDGEAVDPSYGDAVTALRVGDARYRASRGFTPHIGVDYGPSGAAPALWTTGYGDLVNVVFKSEPSAPLLEVTLDAAPGWDAELHGFDLAASAAAAVGLPVVVDAVRVLDGRGRLLFEETGRVVPHTGHEHFEWNPPLVASTLTIQIDVSGLVAMEPGGDNGSDAVGIDNIRFGERGPVPLAAGNALTLGVDRPSEIVLADLDGDGDADLVTASFGDGMTTGRVSWNENLGDGLFGPSRTIAISAAASGVAAGDLDRDGDLDVLASWFSGSKIAWYENLGEGRFGDPTSNERPVAEDAPGAFSVETHDIDGDGDLDVLAALQSDSQVVWYENDGGVGNDAGWSAHTISFAGGGMRDAVAADGDLDGDLDVFSASVFGNTFAFYENLGGGDFGDPFGNQNVISSTAEGGRRIAVADVDRDGLPDVIAASCEDDTVAWYPNLGNDGIGGQRHVGTVDCPESIHAADVDGDGDLDLFAASSGDDGAFGWFRNDGSGGFGPRLPLHSASSQGADLLAADLDDDGDLDLVAAGATPLGDGGGGDSRLEWLENRANHRSSLLLGPVEIDRGLAYGELAIADLDHDGDADLLAGSGDDGRVVWIENEAGSFVSPRRDVSLDADDLAMIVATDVDGDGDIDVVTAEEQLSWQERFPIDPFGDDKIVAAEGSYRSAAAIDVDGDGDTDLVAGGRRDGDGTTGTLSWFANDGTPGDGGWRATDIAELLEEVRAVVAADLNRDGDVDLVAGAAGDGGATGAIACFRGETFGVSAGEQLIGRGDRDTFVGNVYVSPNTPFGVDGRVTRWSFYDDGDPGRSVTPLLFELTDAGSEEYTVRGIGRTRISDGSGVQTFSFDPIAGSSDAVAAHYLYGWKFGTPDNSVQNAGAFVGDFGVSAEPPVYKEWGQSASGPAVFQDVALDNQSGNFRDLPGGRDYSVRFEASGTVFVPDLELPTEAGVDVLQAGDVDGDGDLDLVAAIASRIVWYENFLGEDDAFSFSRAPRKSRLEPRLEINPRTACESCPQAPRGFREHVEAEMGHRRIVAELTGGARFDSLELRDLDDDGDIDLLATVPGDDRVLRYENLDGGGAIWAEHELPGDAGVVDEPRGIVSVDVDGDGDRDGVVASATSGTVAWYRDVGGQYGSTAADRAATVVYEGELAPLLAVELGLNARPGDASARLSTLDLVFEAAPGDPLDGAAVNERVAALRLYRDDGSGRFEAGRDVLVATLADLDTSRDGLLGFPVPDDPNGIVAAPATFFVVAEIAVGAAGTDPPGFRATYQGGQDDLRDSRADRPLTPEPGEATSSAVVSIVAPIGVDSTLDRSDIDPGDRVCETGDGCTLRAAIQEANNRPGDDRILLAAGSYTLTVAGAGENAGVSGDLDVTDGGGSLTIVGAGAERTFIDGNGLDRVFDVLNDARLVLEGVTVTGGADAVDFGGGGIRVFGGSDVTLSGCVVTGNRSEQGGGILNDGALRLESSSVSGNTADLGGGGISNTGVLLATRSLIAHNAAGDHGGIANSGDATIDNSTVSGNVAVGVAGGIRNNGTLVVRNSTIAGNEASRGGGVSNNDAIGAQLTASSSLLAGNSATTGVDCEGTLLSDGFNLLQEDAGCSIVGGTEDLSGVDPLLGPLQDNGGRTETHFIDTGSPAIDRGYCPGLAVDQRGVTRTDLPTVVNAEGGDGCDIGAYEVSFAQSLFRLEVPVRWCVVEGSPSFDAIPDQAEVNRLLRERHVLASREIFVPQGNIKFRSGANTLIPDYPILADPDTTIGNPGDVFIDPEARDFDEFQKLTAECRAAWQALDPSVVGVTAVNINQFVDAQGEPLGILGLGGRAEPGDLAGQLIAGRVMVVDASYGAGANPVDDVDRLLGHELGHALSLSHGDGLDNDGDGILDNDDERFEQAARFDGPNLLQYRNGSELTPSQVIQARLHLETTIPDLFLEPGAGSLADVFEIDSDLKRVLDFDLKRVLDFDLKRVLDFDLKRVLDFDLKRVLDFEEDEVLDFEFTNVLDYGMAFDVAETKLFASVGGLPWPTPVRPDTSWLFYVDLDIDDATGATPGSEGFPLLDDPEAGVDLIATVDLSSSCDLVTMECEDRLELLVFDWDDADPANGFRQVFGPVPADIKGISLGLYQSTGGGDPAREDQAIGVLVQAAIPNAILENALPANTFELGDPIEMRVLTVIPCEQTLPDGTVVDCQCEACGDCPEYPGCTDGGTTPESFGPDLVPGSVGGTITFTPPELPGCSVMTSPAEPGSAVTLLATGFPVDTGMPLQVLAGGQVLFTDPAPTADGDGVFTLFPVIPGDAIVGDLELTVVLESFATSADCFAVVDGTTTPPEIGEVVIPSEPAQAGETVSLTAEFVDNPGDTYTAIWDWGDGTTSEGVVTPAGQGGEPGTVTGSHVYTEAGTYTVTLTLTDGAGNVTRTVAGVIVVFDVDAGFITGGGWILTPAGSYAANPGFAGHTNFGFNARYAPGALVPSGNLNLRIDGAGFRAREFDSLVIQGASARLAGRGTLNGAGDYDFTLTLIDAARTPPGDTDRIRFTIHDRLSGALLYDTQPGAATEAAPTTPLGGGSLVIH